MMLVPTDENEASEMVRAAVSDGTALSVAGGNTRTGIGNALNTGVTLRSTGLSGIVDYQPAEMVMTARAGTPVTEIGEALAANHQMMAFEPMDHRGILGTTGEPTIGGIFAANVSGPRRYVAGAARDSLLGIRFINGQGQAIRAGGRVMKNVTGLDLVKLLAGSHGTLGFLTEVTFRVLPVPQTVETIVISGLDDAAATRAMASAMALPVEVSGAAHVPQGATGSFCGAQLPDRAVTLLRLEGLAASVAVRAETLVSAMRSSGTVVRLGPEESKILWQQIGDVRPYADGTQSVLWRVSVMPSSGYRLVEALRARAGIDVFYDWQGGLVWIRMQADLDAEWLRRGLRELGGGHATLMRAPQEVDLAISRFEPQTNAVKALSMRIRQKLDPAGIFSPGKMA